MVYLTECSVLSVSKSSLSTNFINYAICGGVAAGTIAAHLNVMVENYKDSPIPLLNNVVETFHNNSIEYKGSHKSRAGIAQGPNKSLILDKLGDLFLLSGDKPSSCSCSSFGNGK